MKAVTEHKAKRLVFDGKGKITIDSGAAESLMPKGMLLNEPTIEELATRNRCELYGRKRCPQREPGGEEDQVQESRAARC